jgi:hypothetical protein
MERQVCDNEMVLTISMDMNPSSEAYSIPANHGILDIIYNRKAYYNAQRNPPLVLI